MRYQSGEWAWWGRKRSGWWLPVIITIGIIKIGICWHFLVFVRIISDSPLFDAVALVAPSVIGITILDISTIILALTLRDSILRAAVVGSLVTVVAVIVVVAIMRSTSSGAGAVVIARGTIVPRIIVLVISAVVVASVLVVVATILLVGTIGVLQLEEVALLL